MNNHLKSISKSSITVDTHYFINGSENKIVVQSYISYLVINGNKNFIDVSTNVFIDDLLYF